MFSVERGGPSLPTNVSMRHQRQQAPPSATAWWSEAAAPRSPPRLVRSTPSCTPRAVVSSPVPRLLRATTTTTCVCVPPPVLRSCGGAPRRCRCRWRCPAPVVPGCRCRCPAPVPGYRRCWCPATRRRAHTQAPCRPAPNGRRRRAACVPRAATCCLPVCLCLLLPAAIKCQQAPASVSKHQQALASVSKR